MPTSYGLKIAKPGKSIESTNLDDYIFRSDIESLPLIQKVLVAKNITSGDCTGTLTYTHNLGAFFFAQVFVTDKSNFVKQCLPFSSESSSDKFNCDEDNLTEIFSYRVKENAIDILYDVKCTAPMSDPYCPPYGMTYTFEISIYMLQLGG